MVFSNWSPEGKNHGIGMFVGCLVIDLELATDETSRVLHGVDVGLQGWIVGKSGRGALGGKPLPLQCHPRSNVDHPKIQCPNCQRNHNIVNSHRHRRT